MKLPKAALEPQFTPSPSTSIAEFLRATTAKVSAMGLPAKIISITDQIISLCKNILRNNIELVKSHFILKVFTK